MSHNSSPKNKNLNKNDIAENGVENNKYFADSLDKIINLAKIGLWDWYLPTGKVIYSDQWERIAGYEPGELPQVVQSWQNIVLPDDLEKVNEIIDKCINGEADGYEAEFRIVRKDGVIIWAQDKGSVVERDEAGTPVRLLGIIQDVTRIKNTEDRIKEKTKHLDIVAGISGLAMWNWDIAEGKIIYSDEYLNMLGYDRSELKDTTDEWINLTHPDDRENILGTFKAYLSGKAVEYAQELRIRHKKGHYIWTRDTGIIVKRDKSEAPIQVIGGSLNIDKQKKIANKLKEALIANRRINANLQIEVENAIIKLKESQRMSETLFNSNPYVNAIFNDKFEPIDCNPAAIKYFGFSSKEEFLSNLMNLLKDSIPPVQPDGRKSIPIWERVTHTLEHGYNEFETELIFGGERVPVNFILKKLKYKDTFTIAVYMLDLRSLKDAKDELQTQDRLLRHVNEIARKLMESNIDNFDHTIWDSFKTIGQSIDADRMYIWENYEEKNKLLTTQIYEWSEGAEPQQYKDFTIGLDYEDAKYWRKTLEEGGTINSIVSDLPTQEQDILDPQGVLSILVIPIFLQGKFWGFVGFDDCRNKRIFSEIEKKILQSAGMIIVSAILRNKATKDLINAKEDALQSSKAKSEFLSRMSHEIRTPMNAIIGMTTIAKKADDLQKVNYCLEKISNASAQLLGIINDILDISKIEANKFEIVSFEFDFEKMMQNIFNMIQIRLDEKHLNFTFDFIDLFTHKIYSDELRLTQVMTNLLSNAIKFTPDYGNICLCIRQTPIDGTRSILRVEIKDNGIGITEEQRNRLFNSFEQADGGITRKYGGTGLGLSICKKIVELMDGRIWVESEYGKGSKFIFEIEIIWGGELENGAIKQIPHDNIRILVVDDSEDVLVYFQNILNSYDFGCDVAPSGKDALKMVQKSKDNGNPYEIIFLDWKMPEMNGGDTVREIKKILYGDVIVIMISASDWSDIEGEVSKYGVSRFLPKPILPSTLFNTVIELTNKNFVKSKAKVSDNLYYWPDKSILLVEDVEINREIITSILSDTGLSIDYAGNGLEAVSLYKQNNSKYDLILMDVQMPELDGLQATKQIRASGLYNAREIPIVAMTANAFKEDIMECLAVGMNDHVAKPINIDELMAKMSAYMI